MSDLNLNMPPATDFERRLSEKIEEIVSVKSTGYQWVSADDLLREIAIPDTNRKYVTRFKRAGGGSRAANVLKESPHMTATVYFVVIKEPYTVEQLLDVVIPDMKRNPSQVGALGIVASGPDGWRVRKIVASGNDEIAGVLKAAFPLAADHIVYLAHASAPIVNRQSPTDEVLQQCLDEFMHHASSRQVSLGHPVAADLIATVLSSQMVLFAGPSGTGKSLAARLVADFFSPSSTVAVLESRRQWISPEDVVGYFSPITNGFIRTAHTASIGRLSIPPDEDLGVVEDIRNVPFLIVEEANLSPLEGYLSPIVHGLSGVSTPFVEWVLAAPGQKDDLESQGESSWRLGPFLRVLGTINVDASSPAPAKKVAARAAVVVMEPVPLPSTIQDLPPISRVQTDFEGSVSAGHAIAQDPLAILKVAGAERLAAAYSSLSRLLAVLPTEISVSTRDVHRAIVYMLWFRGVCSSYGQTAAQEESIFKVAAENALLHFVLPGLASVQFRSAVDSISNTVGLSSSEEFPIGGLLVGRVRTLRRILEESEGFFGAMDFWNAMS